jgi:hypothetical protein
MIFEGLEPIAEGEPEVDVRAQGRIFDLHNCATFLGYRYRPPDQLSFSFLYTCDDDQLPTRITRELELRFHGVKDLRVEMEDLSFEGEADTLSHITYHQVEEGLGLFQLSFLDGLDIHFRSRSLSLREKPLR